jgi:hypothetical protein
MLFTAIYEAATCPLPGYDDLTVQVLVNPTNKQWSYFLDGGLEASALLEQREGESATDWTQRQQENRTYRREKLGQALCEIFNRRAYGDLDFSTPAAALTTVEHEDMPDEIVMWLMELPITVRNARIEAMQKKLRSPSTVAT